MDSKSEQLEKILHAIVGVDYDYICLIDVHTKLYEIFKSKTDERIPFKHEHYDTERTKNTALYIAEHDRDRLLKEMDLDYVGLQLQQADKFSTEYEMINSDGSFQYKQDTFFYLDETHHDMVLTRKDITQLIHQEQDDMNRLRRTLLALEKANEADTVLISKISHDFRTPLNGILGFTEIGLQENSAEGKQQSLKKIKSAGNLLLNLVNDFLVLSRMESGKAALEKNTFDCRTIMDPVLLSIRQLAEKKNVHFISDTEKAPEIPLKGDVLKTQKIVLNLLSNAVKFTPTGGTVHYTLQEIVPAVNKMTLRITVEDNGVGMSPDFLKHLFEPFSQEYRPENAGKEGTGLGLSIVRQMVDLMDGTISVQSEINKGTRFAVELPLEKSGKVLTDDESQKASVTVQYNLAGKRILLCEDNRMYTEIASALLEKEKITVECAENGKTGVEKFTESPEQYYDAILMDIRMPVMDGYQATKAIRSLNRSDAKTIPIIALTADAFEESIRTARETGMDGYLIKPFESKKLYEILADKISR